MLHPGPLSAASGLAEVKELSHSKTNRAVVRWYSSDGMAYLAKGIAQASELVKKLNQLADIQIPGVIKWRYTFENDWSGDPAIFFWVTLTDDASRRENLRQATAAFTKIITQHVDLLNDWGLIPYFNFRSESEQAKLKDEVYA